MRAALLLVLALAFVPFAPLADAGWTSVCAEKVGCVAGVCASDCGRDTIVCFYAGPTAPASCLAYACPPTRCDLAEG